MKRVLITGANSYIGENVRRWLLNKPEQFSVDVLDMQSDEWVNHDFSGYDCVYHVAGIAHADVEKITEEGKKLYYSVNCDLAFSCAKKAKESGVAQFIFMSSMIVYPQASKYGLKNMITKDIVPNPDNFYGDSKLQAENKLNSLRDGTYKVVILRPPMIYGKNSKGNYRTLAKMAKRLPVFPKTENERSMLYIENLCEFVRLMIINEEDGTFFPQNSEYVNTAEMVKTIGGVSGKKIHLWKIFVPFISLMSKTKGKYGKLVNKAFGSLTYDLSMSDYKQNYRVCGFIESVRRSEGQ